MEHINQMLEAQDRKLSAIMKIQTQLADMLEEFVKVAREPADDTSFAVLVKLEQSITRQTEVLRSALEARPLSKKG